MSEFKKWFLANCLPDCPMPKWILAVEALPDRTLLEQCAVEWRMLVDAAYEQWETAP